MQKNSIDTNSIQAFEIQQVIFDHSDIVCLEARARLDNELQNVSLMFNFKQFNDLLRFMGKGSEDIQLLISDALSGNEPSPYFIDLKSEPVCVTNVKLKINATTLFENDTFAVEEVQPISHLQQARNLQKNIKDFKGARLNKNERLKDELMKIAKMYRYYKALLGLNINEFSARKQAGLENDKLFRLAVHTSL